MFGLWFNGSDVVPSIHSSSWNWAVCYCNAPLATRNTYALVQRSVVWHLCISVLVVEGVRMHSKWTSIKIHRLWYRFCSYFGIKTDWLVQLLSNANSFFLLLLCTLRCFACGFRLKIYFDGSSFYFFSYATNNCAQVH